MKIVVGNRSFAGQLTRILGLKARMDANAWIDIFFQRN